MSTPSERWFGLHALRRQLSLPPKTLNRNHCPSSRGVLDRIFSERTPTPYYNRRNSRWRSWILRLELFLHEARYSSHTGWKIQCFLGSTQDTAVKLTPCSFKLCDFLNILTVRVTRHTNSTSDTPDSNVPSWSYPTSDSCCSQRPDMYVERMYLKQILDNLPRIDGNNPERGCNTFQHAYIVDPKFHDIAPRVKQLNNLWIYFSGALYLAEYPFVQC